MASNATGIVDDDGDTSDWLELHNQSSSVISLIGWQLRDSSSTFTLPHVAMLPDQRIVIWASGKDRISNGEIHANFKLSSSDESLRLSTPTGATATEFSPSYPAQQADVS